MAQLQFVNIYVVGLFLTMVMNVASQTMCVWNAVDSWDHINGEYLVQSGTHNTYPYWKRTSSSCTDQEYYIFAAYYEPDTSHFWFIHPTLVTDYVIAYPDCEDQPLSASPDICPGGYYEWYSSSNSIQLPLTLTEGTCPSLQCDTIEITGITTAQHTICNKVFTRNTQQDNVFVYTDSNNALYLYFNKYTFKWYCSETLGVDDCADDIDINHEYLSSLTDGWIDLAVGDTATITMSNNEDVSFQCLLDTTDPTSSPSDDPTVMTVSPFRAPTISPSRDPTISPSDHPSSSPSEPTNPTTQPPTNDPSLAPSRNPTAITTFPSRNPSISPSDTTQPPTLNPSVNPTTTLMPTESPTNNPLVISLLTSDEGGENEEKGILQDETPSLQMTSTEHVDKTGLTVAILIIGGCCIIITILACVLWAKHEKAYRPIYNERKQQMLSKHNEQIMKERDEREEKKGSESINEASNSHELEKQTTSEEGGNGPHKRTTLTLKDLEVELKDLPPGAVYEAQDGDVQIGAL